MNILNKLQSLSERKRRIIFWAVMIIVAIFLLIFYIQNIKKRIESSERKGLEEELQLQELQEELEGIQNF